MFIHFPLPFSIFHLFLFKFSFFLSVVLFFIALFFPSRSAKISRWKMSGAPCPSSPLACYAIKICHSLSCPFLKWDEVYLADTLTHDSSKLTPEQCWSESGLVSPAVSPSPQGQSPSPSPSPLGQSPSPSGVSPSPLDQSPSPSPSPLDQSPSPSPSPVGQSPSPSPRVQQKSEWVRTWVRTQPGLMSPTIKKLLYFNPTFNHFCWALYW